MNSKISGILEGLHINEAKAPAKTGTKVQAEFIEFVKKQINLDLGPFRDTQFDNRKGFNIETNRMSKTQLQSFDHFINKIQKDRYGPYEVNKQSNGVTRVYIAVSRRDS